MPDEGEELGLLGGEGEEVELAEGAEESFIEGEEGAEGAEGGAAAEGEEGAEGLEIHRALEKGFERGDVKVIDGWAKDYPAGFKKLILPALEKLETLDQEHFDAITSYLTNKVFERCGVFGSIAAIGEAISAGKTEDAVKHFNNLAKFLGDMK